MTEPAKNAPAKRATSTKKAALTKKAAPTKKATSTRNTAPTKKAAPAKNATAKNAVPTPPDKAGSAAGSKFFKRATDRAKRIAGDPDKLRDISEKASRSSALRSGPFSSVVDDFRALIRLVVAYARGFYRQIPLDKLVVVVAGLIYVVSPVDVIPDVVPGVGFLDDAAVIAWVIKAVREELDAFREWEAGVTD